MKESAITTLGFPLTQLDGTVYINNEPNIVDITRQNPGQTFVGILPGHDRPAFVRKRSRRRSGSCFTDMFRPRRTYSSEHVIHHTYTESNRPYYFNRPSSPHQTKIVTDRPVVISSSGPSLPDRLKKHTCGSCGKFRSATYCQSHPLADGEIPKPSLCRRCIHGKTSSGESDRSYENYVKKEKRRRRRQEREWDDHSYERYRRQRRSRHPSSADDSYEKYREIRSYRRRDRGYTESREDSGYWSWEEPVKQAPRVIYVDRSDSRRCTRSSSGDRSMVSVSVKMEAPKRLRRHSRPRSSAEEVRVVRSIIREPTRPRPRSRERPYRHRYRSETRSEGSVRFDLPPRDRAPRKYRVVNYDGESGPYQPMDASSSRGRSDSAEVVCDFPFEEVLRTRFGETRGRYQDYPRRVVARDERAHRAHHFPERNLRSRNEAPYEARYSTRGSPSPEREYPRRILAREERTYRANDPHEQILRAPSCASMERIEPRYEEWQQPSRGRRSPELAFVTGARGRSLSSERRTAERDESVRRERRQRSRSASRASYRQSASSDENAKYLPDSHSPSRRLPETPTRVSRLVQRLALEDAHDTEPDAREPRRREIEYAHVTPRMISRSRDPSRGRSGSRKRSASRERSHRSSYHSQPITVGHRYGPERYSQRSEDRDRSSEERLSRDFGGRVKHVRVSDRLG